MTVATRTDDEDSILDLSGGDAGVQLGLDGLLSPRFSNIRPLYTSAKGPAAIFTATRYGKRFLLKGLREEFRQDPIWNMALAKEFEIGMQLEHPNIRRTFGLENVDGLGRVIVMEYVDGASLDELLASGSMTQADVRGVMRQIACALEYMHSKQMYHRDLKPSNILVSHSGNVVKIIDFNLSDSEEFVVLKNPAGSLRYMAPEQQVPGARPSAVADIYSFGVILKEAGEGSGDEQLAEVGRKCMNRNPARRPQSVAMLRLPSVHPSAIQSVYGFLSSTVLTVILVCLLLAIAALIVRYYALVPPLI